MPVAADYATSAYAVNSNLIQTVQTAATNAQNIVAQYSGSSDYEKLVGFRNKICELTSYNDFAANSNNNVSYGDP